MIILKQTERHTYLATRHLIYMIEFNVWSDAGYKAKVWHLRDIRSDIPPYTGYPIGSRLDTGYKKYLSLSMKHINHKQRTKENWLSGLNPVD